MNLAVNVAYEGYLTHKNFIAKESLH
jgi:hypothetical protein